MSESVNVRGTCVSHAHTKWKLAAHLLRACSGALPARCSGTSVLFATNALQIFLCECNGYFVAHFRAVSVSVAYLHMSYATSHIACDLICKWKGAGERSEWRCLVMHEPSDSMG